MVVFQGQRRIGHFKCVSEDIRTTISGQILDLQIVRSLDQMLHNQVLVVTRRLPIALHHDLSLVIEQRQSRPDARGLDARRQPAGGAGGDLKEVGVAEARQGPLSGGRPVDHQIKQRGLGQIAGPNLDWGVDRQQHSPFKPQDLQRAPRTRPASRGAAKPGGSKDCHWRCSSRSEPRRECVGARAAVALHDEVDRPCGDVQVDQVVRVVGGEAVALNQETALVVQE